MPPRGGQTYERTNGRTENLPILQDFVPYRGRCPKTYVKWIDPQTDGPTNGHSDPPYKSCETRVVIIVVLLCEKLLYMRPLLSVGLSQGQSVGLSFGPSDRPSDTLTRVFQKPRIQVNRKKIIYI